MKPPIVLSLSLLFLAKSEKNVEFSQLEENDFLKSLRGPKSEFLDANVEKGLKNPEYSYQESFKNQGRSVDSQFKTERISDAILKNSGRNGEANEVEALLPVSALYSPKNNFLIFKGKKYFLDPTAELEDVRAGGGEGPRKDEDSENLGLSLGSLEASLIARKDGGMEHNEEDPEGANFWFNVMMTVVCVLCAALAAGLTMGLVSLEPFQMEILLEANEDDCHTEQEKIDLKAEKECAQAVYPLVKKHHLLLVTLLLLNSIANEALPLFLDQVMSPVAAVCVSVSAVLIFGEILPSAVFTGPNQLYIAAAMAPVVQLLIILFSPIGYPLSRILDRILGEEHRVRYNKAEFRAMINLHQIEDGLAGMDREVVEELENDVVRGAAMLASDKREAYERIAHVKEMLKPNMAGLTKADLAIMAGALELHRVTVRDCMTTLDNAYMISTDATLDRGLLSELMQRGHSRIPVFDGHPHNIRGMLLVKRLVILNPDDCRPVSSQRLLEPLVVSVDKSLMQMLYEFASGKSHLAIASDEPERVLEAWRTNKLIPVNVHMAGIITLEDVIEKLIKHDIMDESDKPSSNINRYLDDLSRRNQEAKEDLKKKSKDEVYTFHHYAASAPAFSPKTEKSDKSEGTEGGKERRQMMVGFNSDTHLRVEERSRPSPPSSEPRSLTIPLLSRSEEFEKDEKRSV